MEEIGGDPGASPFAGSLSVRLDGLDRLLWAYSHKPTLLGRLLAFTNLNARGLLLALFCLLLLALLPALVERFLRRVGMVRPNFQQREIPQSFGLFILLFVAFVFGFWGLLKPSGWGDVRDWFWLVLGYGVLGGIDDRWGDHRHKGLKGHFRALLQDKRITTGLLKAVRSEEHTSETPVTQ